MAEQPNDASRKSKAEGDRPDDEQTRDAAYQDMGEEGGGITSRPMDKETSNQEAVPSARAGEVRASRQRHGHGQQEERTMNRDNRSSSNDPTAELARDQSTQSASGLSTGGNRSDRSDDLVNRRPLDTPRRYDQPIEDDDDPVMPSDDATLNTKI